jgi:hypothetical protein
MTSILNDVNINICKNLLNDYEDNKIDVLSEIMSKYGSDKGWGLCIDFIYNNKLSPNGVCHNYTYFYNNLFKKFRNEKISIFEMGIGVPSCMVSWAGSLKGWQEYFKNCEVFSADIDVNYLYNKDRIRSFYVDQENADSIKRLWEHMKDKTFDLIIDDGPHTYTSNYLFFINSINKLKNGGIYIIEDINLDFIDTLYKNIIEYCNINNIIIEIEKLIIPYPVKFTHVSNDILKMNNLIFIKKNVV